MYKFTSYFLHKDGNMLCSYSVKYIDGVKNESDVLFSLACVTSETHNLQRVFRRILYTNERSLCQAFLAETVETGTKNRCVIEATHILRRKLRKD